MTIGSTFKQHGQRKTLLAYFSKQSSISLLSDTHDYISLSKDFLLGIHHEKNGKKHLASLLIVPLEMDLTRLVHIYVASKRLGYLT